MCVYAYYILHTTYYIPVDGDAVRSDCGGVHRGRGLGLRLCCGQAPHTLLSLLTLLTLLSLFLLYYRGYRWRYHPPLLALLRYYHPLPLLPLLLLPLLLLTLQTLPHL
jgi:hypothetical protein